LNKEEKDQGNDEKVACQLNAAAIVDGDGSVFVGLGGGSKVIAGVDDRTRQWLVRVAVVGVVVIVVGEGGGAVVGFVSSNEGLKTDEFGDDFSAFAEFRIRSTENVEGVFELRSDPCCKFMVTLD
jgi:hypothetical protein